MDFREPNIQEQELKKKTAQSLEFDRVRLLMDQPFIGGILIRQNLVPVIDSRCPTATTDGKNIFVNPEFYFSLKVAERRFLLSHEVWHTVYMHFLRCGSRKTDRFNIACDMEVNEMLRQQNFSLHRSALLPPREWRGLNAESIYEKLPDYPESPPEPFDVHLQKGEAPALPNYGNGENDPVIDPDFTVDFGNDPEEDIREKVIESAVQYEKLRGTLPGNIKKIVEQFQTVKLNWRELLAQYLTPCFGSSRRWLPPNRRYISSGLYLQSRRDTFFQAVLAIDTSGSTADDLDLFAAELTALFNSFGQYELSVICCDARIQSIKTYTQDSPFDDRNIQFQGGGGTSFIPVFQYVEENFPQTQILIYFTDGYGDIPEEPDFPVLWVITPDGRNSIPWGYVIKLPEARKNG